MRGRTRGRAQCGRRAAEALAHRSPEGPPGPAEHPGLSTCALLSSSLARTCHLSLHVAALGERCNSLGFLDDAVDKESACQCRRHRRRAFDP